MNKITLLLCAVLAVAKGNLETMRSISFPKNIEANIGAYVEFNQKQYLDILKYFDTTIANFKQQYLGQVEVTAFDIDMVTATILEIEARINPLEVLSDLSKQCVKQHRILIPTVIQAKENITRCIREESQRIEYSLTSSKNSRYSFKRQYDEYLNEVTNCSKIANNTKCVSDATLKMDSYADGIQKRFEHDMAAADCSAKAYVRSALDCSNTVATTTVSAIAEADFLINNCVEDRKECTPCYSNCTLFGLELDYKSQTMYNPFYNKTVDPRCVIFHLYHKNSELPINRDHKI